jgi:hypothetical protein
VTWQHDDPDDDNHGEELGPVHGVRWYLSDGVDQAQWELDSLASEDRELVERAAQLIVNWQLDLVREEDQRAASEILQQLREDPWIRFAVDLRFAEDGVSRSFGCLERYLLIATTHNRRPTLPNARRYLREATTTFVFGFDAACIALCGAALEQTLKNLLVEHDVLSASELSRQKRTAGAVLDLARRHNLIGGGDQSARHVLRARDHVMHHGIWEERILTRMASECVNHLAMALSEFGRTPD